MQLWQAVDAMGWVVFVLLNGYYLIVAIGRFTTFDRVAFGFEALLVVTLDLMNHLNSASLTSISSYSWGLSGYVGLCIGLRFSDDVPTRLLRWMYQRGGVAGAVLVFYLLMSATVIIESHRPGGYFGQVPTLTHPAPKQ